MRVDQQRLRPCGAQRRDGCTDLGRLSDRKELDLQIQGGRLPRSICRCF
jgi:hypothetical protein